MNIRAIKGKMMSRIAVLLERALAELNEMEDDAKRYFDDVLIAAIHYELLTFGTPENGWAMKNRWATDARYQKRIDALEVKDEEFAELQRIAATGIDAHPAIMEGAL